jgi:hypothetical protein
MAKNGKHELQDMMALPVKILMKRRRNFIFASNSSEYSGHCQELYCKIGKNAGLFRLI